MGKEPMDRESADRIAAAAERDPDSPILKPRPVGVSVEVSEDRTPGPRIDNWPPPRGG